MASSVQNESAWPYDRRVPRRQSTDEALYQEMLEMFSHKFLDIVGQKLAVRVEVEGVGKPLQRCVVFFLPAIPATKTNMDR